MAFIVPLCRKNFVAFFQRKKSLEPFRCVTTFCQGYRKSAADFRSILPVFKQSFIGFCRFRVVLRLLDQTAHEAPALQEHA